MGGVAAQRGRRGDVEEHLALVGAQEAVLLVDVGIADRRLGVGAQHRLDGGDRDLGRGQGGIELWAGDRRGALGRGALEGDGRHREVGVARSVGAQGLGRELDLGPVHRDLGPRVGGRVVDRLDRGQVGGVVLAVGQEEQRRLERHAPSGPVDAHQVELEVLARGQGVRPEALEEPGAVVIAGGDSDLGPGGLDQVGREAGGDLHRLEGEVARLPGLAGARIALGVLAHDDELAHAQGGDALAVGLAAELALGDLDIGGGVPEREQPAGEHQAHEEVAANRGLVVPGFQVDAIGAQRPVAIQVQAAAERRQHQPLGQAGLGHIGVAGLGLPEPVAGQLDDVPAVGPLHGREPGRIGRIARIGRADEAVVLGPERAQGLAVELDHHPAHLGAQAAVPELGLLAVGDRRIGVGPAGRAQGRLDQLVGDLELGDVGRRRMRRLGQDADQAPPDDPGAGHGLHIARRQQTL